MKSQSIGYIRVSSVDQNPDRQLQEIHLDKKFIEVISGKIIERPTLNSCIDYIREGDILYVDSIDRLARNLRNLQEIIKKITEKGVTVKFLKENLTFTLKDDPMANLMLQMMGAFAEFERNMIRIRMREGLDLAKKSGKRLGRKPKFTEEDKRKARELRENGASLYQIKVQMKIGMGSVYKLLDL